MQAVGIHQMVNQYHTKSLHIDSQQKPPGEVFDSQFNWIACAFVESQLTILSGNYQSLD